MHLRKGVRFSNGMELTADDANFAITRTLDRHFKPAPSWGQPGDANLQGAQDFIAGKASCVAPCRPPCGTIRHPSSLGKRKILGENLGRLHGLDVDALRHTCAHT